MFAIKGSCIAGDQQLYLLPAVFNTIFDRRHNRKRVLLKGSPGKTALQQERGENQVQIPGCKSREEEERQGKEDNRQKPEKNPGNSLPFRGIGVRISPPANEPPKQGNRVLAGVRITDQAVHQQCGTQDEGSEHYSCRYHV